MMAKAKVNRKGVAWYVALACLFSWAIASMALLALWLYGRSPVLRKETSLA